MWDTHLSQRRMSFLLGFFLAYLIGVSGIGGGVLTTPLLIFLFSLEPKDAVGTSLLFSLAVKFLSSFLYLLKGQYEVKVLGLLIPSGVLGVILGSNLLPYLSLNERLLFLLLGLIVVISSLLNLLGRVEVNLRRGRSVLITLGSFLVSFEVGLSSIGSGVLIQTLLLSLLNLDVKRAMGTSLIYGFVVSLFGGISHLLLGNVDLVLLRDLTLGGGFGVILGAYTTSFVPSRPLKRTILVVLIIFGINLIWRGING